MLIYVDTEQAPGELVNSRMAYVSVSRAQIDVQMYTNDAKALGPGQKMGPQAERGPQQEIPQGMSLA